MVVIGCSFLGIGLPTSSCDYWEVVGSIKRQMGGSGGASKVPATEGGQ